VFLSYILNPGGVDADRTILDRRCRPVAGAKGVVEHRCTLRYSGIHMTLWIAAATSPWVTVVTPSATAAAYTASVTIADNARRFSTSLRECVPRGADIDLAADRIRRGGEHRLGDPRRAADLEPSRSPGNTRKLLACPNV
jgi:hypothetical protein